MSGCDYCGNQHRNSDCPQKAIADNLATIANKLAYFEKAHREGDL